MQKVKSLLLAFFSVLGHLLAGGIIFYFWRPIALWYWNYRPILGVDFYNLASYVAYLSRHFVWQFNGWKYIWWGGGPLSLDYPTLHAYLILPLLKSFSLVQSVQLYLLTSVFFFLFFSYLLFVEIGKERVLAVVLAVATAFSIGVYGALIWGGSTHYLATQFFLPLTLWLLIKFFNTGDARWFYLSSFSLGTSLLAHQLGAFAYTIPVTALLLLTYPENGEKHSKTARIKRFLKFFFVAVIIGYPQLGSNIGRSPREILSIIPAEISNVVQRLFNVGESYVPPSSIGQAISQQSLVEIAAFNRNQLERFITDTNQLFLSFLAIAILFFVLTFLVRKEKKNSFKIFVFALPTLWLVFHNFLFSLGISLFHGNWYRGFWPLPVFLGMLLSFIWGDFWTTIKERLGEVSQKTFLNFAISVFSGVLAILGGFILLSQNPASKTIRAVENPGYRQQSSAFPDSLNVEISKDEVTDLKSRLVPSWLDPNETQYRLYDADQRVNIWWNALFDMPLARGYIEFPPGDLFTGAFYWTSVTLSQAGNENTLVKSWGFPLEMVYNNALFLIDWFSIKYLEAEHEKSDSYNPLASYLNTDEILANKEKVVIPGWAQLYQVPNGEPLIWYPNEEEYLTYYGIKDELVSPIAHTTNASVIGFIGDAVAYNTFLRTLAAVNLNSRKVIPLRLGEFLDDVSYENLKEMDAVFLYAYDYRNHGKVWGIIERYVKSGGRVFIETGSDVKQSSSVDLPSRYPRELPDVFPFKMSKQEKLGETWQLSGESNETKSVNLSAFGPPTIDGKPWLFSIPNSADDLKGGSKVILSANDIPLIVSRSYGSGKVIWSGMNLPYHITAHKNLEEAKLFQNLIGDFITISPVSYQDFSVKRVSPNKVIIGGTDAKGVFFRENSYPGWTAKLTMGEKSQNLKIYRSGPTYWGFSYVRLPKDIQGLFAVTLSYRGEFWVYFWIVIWLITVLALLDRILFGSRLLIPVLLKIVSPIRARTSKWWEKEGEEQ